MCERERERERHWLMDLTIRLQPLTSIFEASMSEPGTVLVLSFMSCERSLGMSPML